MMSYDPKRMMEEQFRMWSATQRMALQAFEASGQLMQLNLRAASQLAPPSSPWMPPQTGSEPGQAGDGFDGESYLRDAVAIVSRFQEQMSAVASEQAVAMQALMNEMSSQGGNPMEMMQTMLTERMQSFFTGQTPRQPEADAAETSSRSQTKPSGGRGASGKR
jgi:hypothetical protein